MARKNILALSLISTVLLIGNISCSNPNSSSEENKPSSSVSNPSSSQQVENTSSASNSSIEEVEEGFDTSKDVSIKFYTTMGQTLQEVFNAFLVDFNELYPNIHVETQFIGGYDDVRDQMNTEIASGKTDVNIAYCYSDHIATYNTSKMVVALDDFIDNPEYGFSDEEIEDFVPAFFDEGASLGDGKLYSLPFSKSSEVMYYNKDIFEQHNLQIPTHWFAESENDVTSMEYVCKTLKGIYPDSIPLGYDSESNWFITMCAQLGIPYTSATGEHYLFDNDEAKAFVSEFKEWFDKGWVTTKSLYGSYTSALFVEKAARRSFITIGSSAGASHQQPGDGAFEVGITEIPQHDEDNKKVIQQGPNVCIFKSNDRQKELASWLFVKFFTTNVAFQAEFSMASGYAPVIQSVFESDFYKDFAADESNIQAVSTNVCMGQVDNYFTSPAFNGSSQARDVVGNVIIQSFKGDQEIDTIFANAVATCKG